MVNPFTQIVAQDAYGDGYRRKIRQGGPNARQAIQTIQPSSGREMASQSPSATQTLT